MFYPLNVSSKFAICGLPIRLDTYRDCSFNCTYCFANHRVIGAKVEDTVNIKWLRNKFRKIYDDKEINPKDFLEQLLNQRITLHGGGQSDCFQPREKTLGYTKQIVEICNEYDQHILFSTKTADTYDVPLTPDLHSFQLSISNMGGFMEDNVPHIQERIRFFDRLKNNNYKVGIRIQPFIPEITELEAIVDCFRDADHFTIESLKLVPQNVKHNHKLLDEIGLCSEDFKQMGLLNLYPEVRLWYYQPLIEYFEDYGISYSIADNDLHYLTNNNCCCGDKLIHRQTQFHNTRLLRQDRDYSLETVLDNLGELRDCNCRGLFTSNRVNDCVTVEDFYRERYYKKRSPFSPQFQYYEDAEQMRLDNY